MGRVLWILLVIQLLLFPTEVLCQDPVVLVPGDEVPYAGVLTSYNGVARAAVEILSLRQIVAHLGQQLESNQQLCSESMRQMGEECEASLESLGNLTTPVAGAASNVYDGLLYGFGGLGLGILIGLFVPLLI